MARILYVDDEEDIREVATMSLELDPDLEVRACATGEEALAMCAAWAPDLVLLDVMMPGMDGPTTCERLRELPEGRHVPVVFITARTQAQDAERLSDLGAAGVIGKPFDPMTLAARVKAFLR